MLYLPNIYLLFDWILRLFTWLQIWHLNIQCTIGRLAEHFNWNEYAQTLPYNRLENTRKLFIITIYPSTVVYYIDIDLLWKYECEWLIDPNRLRASLLVSEYNTLALARHHFWPKNIIYIYLYYDTLGTHFRERIHSKWLVQWSDTMYVLQHIFGIAYLIRYSRTQLIHIYSFRCIHKHRSLTIPVSIDPNDALSIHICSWFRIHTPHHP